MRKCSSIEPTSDKHGGDLPATLEKERKEDEAEPDAR